MKLILLYNIIDQNLYIIDISYGYSNSTETDSKS
jgi:hypothetical protein